MAWEVKHERLISFKVRSSKGAPFRERFLSDGEEGVGQNRSGEANATVCGISARLGKKF